MQDRNNQLRLQIHKKKDKRICIKICPRIADQLKNPYFKKKKKKKLTRVRIGDGGRAGKIAGGGLLAKLLKVAIDGIATVGPDGVGLETGPVLVGGVAVRPGSTCVVQSLLQHCIA